MRRILTGILCLAVLLAATAALAQSTDSFVIEQRAADQQNRIQEGIATGQLTPKEADGLEKQQGSIATQKNRMKADGKLTKAERAKLNVEQDLESKSIHKHKLDAEKVAK